MYDDGTRVGACARLTIHAHAHDGTPHAHAHDGTTHAHARTPWRCAYGINSRDLLDLLHLGTYKCLLRPK